MPLAAFILTVVVAQIVLSFTRFGRQLYMVGSNWRAALGGGPRAGARRPRRLCRGRSVHRACRRPDGGALFQRRYGDLASAYDYSAISAVLVGGTAISGGEGSAIRSLAGAFIIAVCQGLLLLNGFSTQIQYLAIGIIVLLVIMLQTLADCD